MYPASTNTASGTLGLPACGHPGSTSSSFNCAAHRSQYVFVEGGARWMRDALPNATFVGFTGTPLMAGDKVTRHVFGEYADVYDIRQAVADNATVPIYYEPRIVKLTIDELGAKEAERKIAEAAKADEAGQEAAENVRVPLESLYGAPERLERVAAFVVEHWEKRRSAMEGNAMLVTMSRDIAVRLYEEIRKLRPAWHDEDDAAGVMKVVMNENLPPQREGEEDAAYAARVAPLITHGRSKTRRKELAQRFKDPADDFRLAIVVDMWLTGFDVAAAHTHGRQRARSWVDRSRCGRAAGDWGGAVDAGEVIDLFAAAGLGAARLDILSEEFMSRVAALEQKNLALETLRKLLADQIKVSERTNLVQAQRFREALEKAMIGYTNKQITTAEMIAQGRPPPGERRSLSHLSPPAPAPKPLPIHAKTREPREIPLAGSALTGPTPFRSRFFSSPFETLFIKIGQRKPKPGSRQPREKPNVCA